MIPVLLAKGIQKISSGAYRFVPSDLFVVLAGFWLIYGPANVDDPMVLRQLGSCQSNQSAQLMINGMVFSGVSPNGRLVEIVELADHPWFVASQFHPEFRSRPNRAHPLFRDFVRAAFLQSGIDQMELRPAELLEDTETP